MILKSEHFFGRFEKIAQSITSLTSSSSLRSSSKTMGGKRSGSFNSTSQDNRGKLNLQSTLSKSRDKADLQPLHKDTETIYRPADQPFASKMRNKQQHLSHLEDKRITRHN